MNETMEIKSIRNPVMTLITEAQMNQLVTAGYNGMIPIVKLFVGPVTMLLTGYEDGYFYGFQDLSMGCVEWGGITNEEELPTMKAGPFYLERDLSFNHVDGTNYLKLETLAGI